ncbi:MAG: hypothetical protein HY000_41845 [Planctomycetes bacterium]|nr:hypothetical protein [Planctomycetota bacterium]
MTRRPLQFGLSSLMWLVAFAAANCWLFSLGAWGGILAVVIDKHVLVAYLCMRADVDRRARKSPGAETGVRYLLPKRLPSWIGGPKHTRAETIPIVCNVES